MTEHRHDVAPGWYPDATGTMRWWDGNSWTEHVVATPPPPAGRQAARAQRPALPEGTQPDSAWTWILVVLPFVLTPFLFLLDFRGHLQASMAGDLSGQTGFLVQQMLLSLGGLVVTGLSGLVAYLEYRTLQQRGVVRPFHWAFAFLGAIVYLIGRHVVLRKVCKTPGWPLWAHVALSVAYVIAVLVWVVWLVQSVFAGLTVHHGY